MTRFIQPNLLVYAGLFLLLTGCASARFYSDPGLRQETGLRVYAPKPYLLVEYNSVRSGSAKTSIVYLPDHTRPQYIRVKPGLGSSALKLELENGMLKAYGLTTDSKVPETLGKVAELLSKTGSAASDFIRSKTGEEEVRPSFELFEIVISEGETRLVPVK